MQQSQEISSTQYGGLARWLFPSMKDILFLAYLFAGGSPDFPKIAAFAVLSFVLTNVVAYWLNLHDYGELYYAWMAPALLVSFLVVCCPQAGIMKSSVNPY